MRVRSFLSAALVAGIFSFSTLADAQTSGNQLGKFVVVGDSLAAGFQNFSLYTSSNGGQQFGFAEVVAKQAGTDLNLPTVAEPGLPPALYLVNPATGEVGRENGVGVRTNLTQTSNLSVPGYLLADALQRTINVAALSQNPSAASPIDVLAAAVLGVPGNCGVSGNNPNLTFSSVQCAAQLKPNTILVSIGSNDVLQTVMFGKAPTVPGTFKKEYGQLLSTLAATGARIIVTNVPDVTTIPFLVPVPAFEQACGAVPTNGQPGDYVVPNIADPNFTGSICGDYAVVPAASVQDIQDKTAAYNNMIRQLAAQYNAAVFDLHGLFASIAQNGYAIGSTTLTAAPGGGLFSLDGIHPTNTGSAIIANGVIGAMNAQWHTSIAPVSLADVLAADPLAPRSASH